MIRNPDGTPYELGKGFEQFNPCSPMHDLYNLWDQEAIRQGGSPILYYEVFVPPQSIDPVWLEARGKLFAQHPVELYCIYDPRASQNFMNHFGLDDPGDIKFEFNYKEVLDKVGHPPKIGSRLYTPHLRENWQIVQRNLGEFRGWGALRLEVICTKFQESMTTGEGRVTSDNPLSDIKIV